MARPRPDTLNNREPTPPGKPDDSHPDATTDDDERIVFSSWDAPLVPPASRRE